MKKALAERHLLIENRAATLTAQAIADGAAWAQSLGNRPDKSRKQEAWNRYARTVAAYRDRYSITSTDALGQEPNGVVQKIDHARAAQALQRGRALTVDHARPQTAERACVRERGRTL